MEQNLQKQTFSVTSDNRWQSFLFQAYSYTSHFKNIYLRENHEESIEILFYAFVADLSESENTFHNLEDMLDFAPGFCL